MELLASGVSCLAAIAFSVYGRELERDVEILKSVIRIQQLRDLSQMLDEEKSPLVVAISGRVDSETPIECQMSRLSAVIIEEQVKELYLEKNKKMRCNDDDSWKLRSKMITSIPKEVPWYLDDGTDRVHVVGARGATGFVLPAENSTFEESGQTRVNETVDGKKEQKLGFKRIEAVLPVGTSLNVVGEASKDDDGTVRIQRPPKGPFYVSSKTIDEHTRDLVVSSRWCTTTSVCMTGVGLMCLLNSKLF